MKNITVLSGEIPIYEITAGLLQDGIVVLQTVRHHARALADKTAETLGVSSVDEESERSFIHLSVEVQGQGWSNFFIYSPTGEYEPEETQRLVRNAVLSWEAQGSPDKYIAVVH